MYLDICLIHIISAAVILLASLATRVVPKVMSNFFLHANWE